MSVEERDTSASTGPTLDANATQWYSSAPPPPPGLDTHALPGYEIQGRLGAGGMGVVYKARHLGLNRIVALKMVRTGDTAEPEELARFVQEAEAVARLQHPHIIQVHDVGRYQGLPYFTMEFVEGGSLAQKLEGTPQPIAWAVDTVETLARAMHVAHQHGIIHRDLKPANVLLSADGGPKITDFGLAKRLEQDSGLTQSGAVLGTPSYMAPEQARGDSKGIGAGADVYALGAILYEMLTGRPPFRGETQYQTVVQVQNEEPVPPSRLNPRVPRDVQTICLKCLQKDPAKRYADAAALADDLRRFSGGEPILARPIGVAGQLWRWCRRKPAVAGLLASVTVTFLLGIAAAFWYVQDRGEREAEELRQAAELQRKQLIEQAEHEAEQVRQAAELERKKSLSEQSINEALQQAEKSRAALHQVLRGPGGVFTLLNDPNRWQTHLDFTRLALERARTLWVSDRALVGPAPGENVRRLLAMLEKDEADRKFALRLEKIRSDKAMIAKDGFDVARAAGEYAKAFAEFRLVLDQGDVHEVAERIRQSPVREQLVAALDDWATISGQGTREHRMRLLAIARLADPTGEWGTQVRQPGIWNNPLRLAEITAKPPPTPPSPHMLYLIGLLLPDNSPEKEPWLRKAQDRYPSDFWLNLALGTHLMKKSPAEAAGFFRAAVAVRRDSSVAYTNLGTALHFQKRWTEAVAAYRKAIDCDGKNLLARSDLALALVELKRFPEAERACRQALALDAKHGPTWKFLGDVYFYQELWPQAIGAYEQAATHDRGSPFAHNSLGAALLNDHQLAEAQKAFEKAVSIDAKFGPAQHNLGRVLYLRKRMPQAIDAFEKSLALNQNDGPTHFYLGRALAYQKRWPEAAASFQRAVELMGGRFEVQDALAEALYLANAFADAEAATRKELAMLPKGHPLCTGARQRLDHCLRMQAMEKRLPLALAGKGKTTPAELVALAQLSLYAKRRPVAAVQLYERAFADTKLFDDRDEQHRYHAACAAAHAAAGSSDEAGKLKPVDKSRYHQKARDWLRAELNALVAQHGSGPAPSIVYLLDRLGQWQQDGELAAVRDADRLARLPDSERMAWEKLWAEVREALAKVQARVTETRNDGVLTARSRSKTLPFDMAAGNAYVIDLESEDFDTLLRVVDSKGNLVEMNDDVSPTNFNSRVILVAPAPGTYGLVAGSFQNRGIGFYSLRIRAIK